ncbi:linker for activation of T-cells family member 1 isoform X2 [Mastomys coucha]|uniref:linker for activation of T-cells family member 1 isoform X2 n=1 Tax=Mastomys coucha TaxID=35658 RepID=UPI001261434D|nr:linker for activation of T-cells family member 1 isoform X2 [Mastomys coucha]
MEADALSPVGLGLLLLPFLVTLLAALCVRCRELPTSYDSASTESLYPGSILIKPPQITVPRTPATSYPPVTSFPPLRQPDLLPIPRSPQPLGGSHRMPSSRQNSDDEPACKNVDEDEDEDDYPEGYLVVLPDSSPAAGPVVSSAPVPSNPDLGDSAFSMESCEDYVNVPESEESAEASLDGSQEYVNVSQEQQPVTRAELASVNSQEVEDEGEEEGLDGEEAPDYENLQELN